MPPADTPAAGNPPQPETCQVHHMPLEGGLAELSYGLPAWSDAYCDARRTLFPNSRLVANMGCILGPPGQKRVLYCPKCREAELAWKEPAEPRFEDTF